MLLATPGLLDQWVWVPVRGWLVRWCGPRGVHALEEVVYAAAVAPAGPPRSGGGAAAAHAIIRPLPRYGPAPSSLPLPCTRVWPDEGGRVRPRSLLEERLLDQPCRYGQAAQLAAANLQLACREAEVSF